MPPADLFSDPPCPEVVRLGNWFSAAVVSQAPVGPERVRVGLQLELSPAGWAATATLMILTTAVCYAVHPDSSSLAG